MTEPGGSEEDAEPATPTFSDRASHAATLGAVKVDEDRPSTWSSCIVEGYLLKGGGRTGTKKPKKSFFRLREHLIVYYKLQQQDPGKKYTGKP